MSCAACQTRIEKAVSRLPGVNSVSVSLVTNRMGVEGAADEQAIIKAVQKAGYGCEPADQPDKAASRNNAELLEDRKNGIIR